MNPWQKFAALLEEESRLLSSVGTAALALTEALIANDPEQIEHAERHVEAARLLHGAAYGQRIAMMQSGFGSLTLQQVCAYAPPPVRRSLYNSTHEIGVRAMALRLTVQNNKALILAAMERLSRIVSVLQRAGTEQTGTYKRRGNVPPPTGSVIVSRRA